MHDFISVQRKKHYAAHIYRTIYNRQCVSEILPLGKLWFLGEKIGGGKQGVENRCPGSSRQLEHPWSESRRVERRTDENIPTNWLHSRHADVRARPTAIGNWDTWKRLASSEGGISRFSVTWLMKALSRVRERASVFVQIDKPSDDRSHFERAHIPPLSYRGLSNVL